MSKEQKEFTEDEFQYLEHLKIVYDASNEMFLKRQFRDYIPLGLAIIYMATSTLESKYWKDPCMFNTKCIDVGELFHDLLYKQNMRILDNKYNPIEATTVKLWIDDIVNYKSDNYANILCRLVSYESLYNVMVNDNGISLNDNRIKAIVGLWNGIKDKGFTFNSEYKNNDVLYTSIKHLRNKELSRQLSLLAKKGVNKPTIARIKECISYMKEAGIEQGSDLADLGHKTESWLAELVTHRPSIQTNQTDFLKAARLIKLFTFPIGTTKKSNK